MKMSCFKFHHNHIINEEFDFSGRGGAPGGYIFSVVSRKALMWNGVRKLHAKFRLGSSIRKLSKIGGTMVRRRNKASVAHFGYNSE